MLNFLNYRKAHAARKSVFLMYCTSNPCWRLGCRWVTMWDKNKRKKIRQINGACNFTHIRRRNRLNDLDEILRVHRYPRCNYVYKIWWWSVNWFGRGDGSNFPFFHRPQWTLFHIVESCPPTKLNGGLYRLHSADEELFRGWPVMVHDTHTRRRRSWRP